MVCKLLFAVNSRDDSAVQNFVDRIKSAGIQTSQTKYNESYKCFEATWDSSVSVNATTNPRNAGAKLKQLRYNGKAVPCGSVYLAKSQKKLSNAQIGELFGVSESTISRRIKRHLEDGDFHERSKVIF